jgi:hypothetical protein
MMHKSLRLALLILATAAVLPAVHSVKAYEPAAVQLTFNPAKDSYIRSMFQLALYGDQVSPGLKDQIGIGEYLIGTVYKDTTLDSLLGLNRHRITFYEYNAQSSDLLGQDRVDHRFGGNDAPDLPKGGGDNGGGNGGGGNGGGNGGGGGGGGGNGGGGGGAAGAPLGSDFLQGLNLPGSGRTGGAPNQQEPGGGGNGGGNGGNGNGGGKAGQPRGSALALDTTQIRSLDYVENKRGEVLDVSGLDTLRKVSKAQLINNEETDRNYVNINVSHVFEWSHLLYVPEYPVYKDDVWFHSFPLHIPGLPDDQPVMTKFIYSLVDFRTVGTRKLAVIDMSGIAEWNMKWEDRNQDELTEYKSWGKMGVTTRYWFDYEKGQIFGMERPPFADYQYGRFYDANELDLHPLYQGLQLFDMRYPGQVITMEFFYNTRVTDVSGKPRLVAVEPKEQRRFIDLIINNQMESE